MGTNGFRVLYRGRSTYERCFFKGYIEYPDSDLISWGQGLCRDYGDVAVQGLRVLGCSGFLSLGLGIGK